MNTEIFFVRHGETASNALGLLHGSTDVPLNDNGRLQASRVADRLAMLEEVAALHSSPLSRARATADEIGRRLGIEPTDQIGLAEIDFGAIEGLGFQELVGRHPELWRNLQDPSESDAAFPGGESLAGFHERVRNSLERLVKLHAGERIVVVAHGGVIASGIAQLVGEGTGGWGRYMVRNCSVTQMTWRRGSVALDCWDDVSHLDVVPELAR